MCAGLALEAFELYPKLSLAGTDPALSSKAESCTVCPSCSQMESPLSTGIAGRAVEVILDRPGARLQSEVCTQVLPQQEVWGKLLGAGELLPVCLPQCVSLSLY